MQVVLVMFRADGERRSFSITRDVTVIGRREDCDLRIPLSDVSRKHCRILRQGDELRIEDLGSSNGTYLNGIRVQEQAVHAGDTLNIGPVVFCAQIDGLPVDEDLAPLQPMAQEPAEYTAPTGVTVDDDLPPGDSYVAAAASGSLSGSAAEDALFEPAVEGSSVGSMSAYSDAAAGEEAPPESEAAAPVAAAPLELSSADAAPVDPTPAEVAADVAPAEPAVEEPLALADPPVSLSAAETQAPHDSLGGGVAEEEEAFFIEDSAHGGEAVAEGDELAPFDLAEESDIVDIEDESSPADDGHANGR